MSAPVTRRSARRGRELRRVVSRSAHAVWLPGPDRPDPIDLLATQDRSRLRELVPIRYGRMAASPLAFLRGAALPMAADLAETPRSGPVVQLCGDAHLANFGILPHRSVDSCSTSTTSTRSLPGPSEMDVKRLAASLEVAGRERGARACPARAPSCGRVAVLPARPCTFCGAPRSSSGTPLSRLVRRIVDLGIT